MGGKRHYCTYCGAKKAESKMTQVYYKLCNQGNFL